MYFYYHCRSVGRWLATVAAQFYDMLAVVRPELSLQDVVARRNIRADLIVDAAVMTHGYAAVMKDYNSDIAHLGPTKARERWRGLLEALSKENEFHYGNWKGEIFDKKNSLWSTVGVLRIGPDLRKITVLNTGAARGECGRVLRQLLAVEKRPKDLTF